VVEHALTFLLIFRQVLELLYLLLLQHQLKKELFTDAARPPLQSFLDGPSVVICVEVVA
jgi:hypothetical protein